MLVNAQGQGPRAWEERLLVADASLQEALMSPAGLQGVGSETSVPLSSHKAKLFRYLIGQHSLKVPAKVCLGQE